MTANSVPKLLAALRVNVPDVATWTGVSKWVARDWSLSTRQPKPDKRAKLVRAARKHVARVLELVAQVEREGKAMKAKQGGK